MPKSLYSSRECPDSMADRLAAHRFGVFACTVLTVFGSLWISNAMSVREEERVLAATSNTLDIDEGILWFGIGAHQGVGVPHYRGRHISNPEVSTPAHLPILEEVQVSELK